MKTSIEHTFKFGQSGNVNESLLYGWSLAEDGYRWTIGHEAALLVSDLRAPHGFFLELTATPHVTSYRQRQRMILTVNETPIDECYFTETRRFAWYCPLPTPERTITIKLELPDAVCPDDPRDTRVLGIAVRTIRLLALTERYQAYNRPTVRVPDGFEERVTGLNKKDLAIGFESVGINCELGLFQRAVGIEPLGLFRFSSGLTIPVVNGLDEAFARLGNPQTIKPQPDKNVPVWAIFEHNYHMLYHTWVPMTSATEAEMVAREVKRLSFLKRKFLSDLAEGYKVFVHQRPDQVTLAEMLPLFLAIRRHGEGRLLWCCPVDDDHPAGMVEELLPGLMCGRLGTFSKKGHGVSLDAWTNVLAAAWLLTHPSDLDVLAERV